MQQQMIQRNMLMAPQQPPAAAQEQRRREADAATWKALLDMSLASGDNAAFERLVAAGLENPFTAQVSEMLAGMGLTRPGEMAGIVDVKPERLDAFRRMAGDNPDIAKAIEAAVPGERYQAKLNVGPKGPQVTEWLLVP